MKRTAPAAVLAAALIAGSALPAFAAYKKVRDISVTCGFIETCTLSTSQDKVSGLYTLSIERKAGPRTEPVLVLAPSELAPRSTVSISVDGRKILDIPVSSFAPRGEDGEYRYADKAGMTKLIDALKAGNAAEVQLRTTEGPLKAEFSLAGFVGGLIFMDETQGRVGTVDALQAKGNKLPAPLPQVSAIDSFDEIPKPIRADFTGEDSVCGGIDADRFSTVGGFAAKIGDRTLLGLPCSAGGAYNQPYVFYQEQGGRVTPLALPVMGDAGPTTSGTAWNIDWNQGTKTLTAFFRARGIGDCGVYNVWKASESDEDGISFVLQQSRSKDDCDGNDGGGPENWPAIWPAKRKS
ncbi:DUF1176 domain-containing protein [Phyllobacterium phragmitis]|uniref:DUF1176 domain-containing protein n=2 Tax=Phyllobacterium phragmitis TaxID=2670329 RepID=A0A2S9IXZ5_9HYPH|nr:DUF1176 domain-containing protein [Phyllobacterium phragmitis]